MKITSSPEFVSEPFVSELFEWLDPPHESSFLVPVPIMTGPENGLVWFKVDTEPVLTGSCWVILCWTEPRRDAIALGALLWRFETCGCQNWPMAERVGVDCPIGNGLLFPIWVGWSRAAKLAWYICNIDDISCSIWIDFLSFKFIIIISKVLFLNSFKELYRCGWQMSVTQCFVDDNFGMLITDFEYNRWASAS